MSNPTLNCKKCHKELNYLSYHSYAEPPAMKSKEGEFYCFDCFKSVSHCKVCNKSVAQLDINIHDKNTWYQPWEKVFFREAEHIHPFDMCGKWCDFLCSPECFAQDENRHHEAWMKKRQVQLAKGWKNCEACMEIFENLFAEFAERDKKLREQAIINHAYLVPPSEKVCKIHKIQQEKNRYIKEIIYPKAQKWWDNLTYEQKLVKVKEHDIVWIFPSDAKKGKKCTHEEVANYPKVPPFIVSQEFQYKEPCISCGKVWEAPAEINCGKNSPTGKPSYCASCPSSVGKNESSSMEKEKKDDRMVSLVEKENQLKNLKKEKGDDSEEVHKLEQEIEELLKTNSTSENPTKDDKSKIITYSIIGFSLLGLIGLAIMLVKSKRKNPKIK